MRKVIFSLCHSVHRGKRRGYPSLWFQAPSSDSGPRSFPRERGYPSLWSQVPSSDSGPRSFIREGRGEGYPKPGHDTHSPWLDQDRVSPPPFHSLPSSSQLDQDLVPPPGWTKTGYPPPPSPWLD